jgi:hypothetical protein
MTQKFWFFRIYEERVGRHICCSCSSKNPIRRESPRLAHRHPAETGSVSGDGEGAPTPFAPLSASFRYECTHGRSEFLSPDWFDQRGLCATRFRDCEQILSPRPAGGGDGKNRYLWKVLA